MPMSEKIEKSENEWKKILDSEKYHILREHGTERAFTGKYVDHHDPGEYVCAGCALPLFDSDTKYDSRSGWPSFFKPKNSGHIEEIPDDSLGMRRIELRCARCGGHLGHVFPDGPRPTGLRYCINSASLDFKHSNE